MGLDQQHSRFLESLYVLTSPPVCNPQTVRNAIHAFNERGLPEAHQRGSERPHTIYRAFDSERAEDLRELLHRSPREDTNLWNFNGSETSR